MNYYRIQDGLIAEGPVADLEGKEFPRELGWIPEIETENYLEQIKMHKQAWINEQRDELEAAGFPFMQKIIDSDARSVKRISIAVSLALASIAMQQDFSVTWVAQDNSTLELDAVALVQMNAALAYYATALHYAAREAKDRVLAAGTVQEVLSVQVSWPVVG